MKIQVTKEKIGYSASVDEYSIYTQGDTFEELTQNITEAISLRFEGSKNPKVELLRSFEIVA
jgi:predicted RNase H-like HicB family nuclease